MEMVVGQKLSTLTALAMLLLPGPAWAEDGSSCQVVQKEVQAYLASGASCPCPYSVTHDHHACGRRSAWAKQGGSAPRCFVDEAAARASAPVLTRQPDAEASCRMDVLTRPAPARDGEVLTAGLVGAE